MHHYRITVEAVDRPVNAETGFRQSIELTVENHDDLFRVVEAVRSKNLLDNDKSAALGLGLKLISEVVLENRKEPLFVPLLQPIRSFIEQLKRVSPHDDHNAAKDTR